MPVSSRSENIEDWINEDWILLLLLEEGSSVLVVVDWGREISFDIACPVGRGGIQLPLDLR